MDQIKILFKNGQSNVKRLTILAVAKFIAPFCQQSSRVTFLPGNLCLKSGRNVRVTEAITMEYIRKHTNVPVPKVYCALTHHDIVYILMERMPGTPLGHNWLQRTETSKTQLLQQLRDAVNQLRSLTATDARCPIAAVDGGPFLDERLPGTSGLVGPFASVKQFHAYLRSGYELNATSSEDVKRLFVLHEETSEEVRFTHNDLSSFNVLVDDDRITGIVDWENAAWLPSYWEFTSAWHVNPQNMFWQDQISKFLDPFERELDMERLRRQHFGDY